MTLAGALKRENNNFDLLRLIAACLVIVGHAYALVPDESSRDLVLTWLNFDYSGSLAVKFFFFISGLVVTNSLLEKPSLGAFAQARLFRLMPAMIVCVLLTAFVLGPAVTSLPLAEYFSDRRT
jgi:peptidoglycan/LPS O-acetylase OafA/YrhL